MVILNKKSSNSNKRSFKRISLLSILQELRPINMLDEWFIYNFLTVFLNFMEHVDTVII